MSKLDKIEELQRLIKEDSSNFQARRQLAMLLTDCGFNEEALGHLLYLSRNFDNDEGVFYNLGIVYEKMKKFPKAKDAYLRAVELDPQDFDAVYNLGLVYTELKEYEPAIDCFNKIIENDPEDSNTFFNLGLVYFKLRDYVPAIDNFQKTIDLNDEDIYAHFYIGNIYKELGDLESARECFNRVLQISPDYSWAYYNLAVIDFEEGNFESAVFNLSKTIEINPADIEAYKVLAKILVLNNLSEEACNVIATALENCTATGDLYYIAYRVYKAAGDVETCEKYLSDAIYNYKTLSISVDDAKKELSSLR